MRRLTYLRLRRAFSTGPLDLLLKRAKQAVLGLSNDPTNAQKLQLYALFKVAESGGGPASGRPGFMDMVNRAKWDAWDSQKALGKEEATKKYVELVKELCGGELPEIASAQSSPSTAGAVSSAVTPKAAASPKEMIQRIFFPRRPGTTLGQQLETIICSMSESGVLTVKLNRPKKGNAMNMAMWRDLFLLFDAIRHDSKVRCVILTGNQSSFCTGMDLSVFSDLNAQAEEEKCEARKREGLAQIITYFQDGISLPEKCHIPVIAAISGSCIGGAVDLVTSCDLRLCTTTADFSVKEIDLSIVADIGTLQRLPRLIGDMQARDLSFTGRHFNGEEAVALGLCLGPAYASEEEMLRAAEKKAELIATKSPLTMRGIKKSLNYSRDHSVAEGLDHVKMLNSAQLYSTDLIESMMQKGKFTRD